MSVLDIALELRTRGWSIIPIALGTKKPPPKIGWQKYQSELPDAKTLRRWFQADPDRGLAVVFGEVSGGLIARDYDEPGSYERWAEEHPHLAAILPTVKTAGGWHVYARANIREAVALLGGSGNRRLGDGELRVERCYCVLPPSIHPEGPAYEWRIPLGDDPPPLIDVVETGFLPCNTAYSAHAADLAGTSKRSTSKLLSATPLASQDGGLSEATRLALERAITKTLPTGPRQRNRRVFDFVRELKAIPEIAETNPVGLRWLVKEWHKRALPYIRTQAFDDTWIDFLEAWDNLVLAADEGFVKQLGVRLRGSPLPPDALAFEDPQWQRLIALLVAAQAIRGDMPFFLSARQVETILGIDFTTAWRWLNALCRRRVLELVEAGNYEKRRSNVYRYLGTSHLLDIKATTS